MNLYQCCGHTANLLHVPVRLYNASGLLVRQFPEKEKCRDLLAADHAFRKRLLKRAQKDFPMLHREQDVMLYGVMRLSDGQCVVLGPVGWEEKAVPLRDFCEGLLLLDDFYWGHGLTYENLVDLNFGRRSDREEQADSLLTAKCKEKVRSHLYEKITVKELAAELHVTPAYLSRVFHEEQGVTLSDYITREKIARACEMLRYTDCSYEAIAYELGFSSQSYFGAVFKKLEGVTPKDFRRRNQLECELFDEEKNGLD